MEHELPEALDGIDEPVTMEGLEEVVRRASQRRRASLVAGAAGLLVVGGLGGALARGPAGDRPLGFAGQQGQAAPPSTRVQAMPAPGEKLVQPSLTPLFRREANGVSIRAYRAKPSPMPILPDQACSAPTSFVQVELSNAAAAGMTGTPEVAGDSLTVLGAEEFGRDEGEPATSAIVRTGVGVATIRLQAGAASDAMAPQDGIAVLVVPGSGLSGVVEGLDAAGAVVATQPLVVPTYPTPSPACLPPPCVAPGGEPAATTSTAPGSPGPAPGGSATSIAGRGASTTSTTGPGGSATSIAGTPNDPGHDHAIDGPIACGAVGTVPSMPPGAFPGPTILGPGQAPMTSLAPPPANSLAPPPTPPTTIPGPTTATSSPPAS